MRGESLLIIVPVFNGSNYLQDFMERMPKEFHSSLIFVDDGSKDESLKTMKDFKIRYLHHEQNLGKGAALKIGLKEAMKLDTKNVITLDVDLQHPPENIYDFQPRENNTVLLGCREKSTDMPLLRKFSNFLTSLLISIRTNTLIRDSQCGFRSFPLKLAANLSLQENGFQFESEFLLKAALKGAKITHVPIPTIYSIQNTAMKPLSDTIKFIRLWLSSYLWT